MADAEAFGSLNSTPPMGLVLEMIVAIFDWIKSWICPDDKSVCARTAKSGDPS